MLAVVLPVVDGGAPSCITVVLPRACGGAASCSWWCCLLLAVALPVLMEVLRHALCGVLVVLIHDGFAAASWWLWCFRFQLVVVLFDHGSGIVV